LRCAASLAGWHGCCHLAVMLEWIIDNWNFHVWRIVAIAGALVAAISIFADWRRQKRKSIENVGFMPWTAISMLAIGVTLLSAALAVKAG
jgi:hypothetical protein